MPSETFASVAAQRAQDKARIGTGNHPDANVIYSLNGNPLGALQGEANLVTPFNTPRQRPIVSIVNWSRTKKRRVCVVPVSWMHGGEEALMHSKEYKQLYNLSMIYEMAKTRDMSIYEEIVRPAWLRIEFDGVERYIAPAPEDDPDNPPIVQVDEGVWDNYCGNYERMHGDAKTQNLEMQRLANVWLRKRNPLWRINDQGAITENTNPFGFAEFIREMPREAPRTRDDKPFLTALDMVE